MGQRKAKGKIRFNEEFTVLSNDGNDGRVILQNSLTKLTVTLSEPELDIIRYYGEYPEFGKVKRHFDEFELTDQLLGTLLTKAFELTLLIDDTYIPPKKEKKRALPIAALNYILVRLTLIAGKLTGLKLNPVFAGSFLFFRLVSADLSGSWMERLGNSRVGRGIVYVFFWVSFAIMTGLVAFSDSELSYTAFINATFSWYWTALIVFVTVFVTLILHEAGHYMELKRFGGKANEIGAGFLYGFLPICFTNVTEVGLWEDKWRRIQVTVAGIWVDVWLILFFAVLVLYTPSHSWSAYIGVIMLFYMVIRLLTNMNFLIPNTDGYFIFCDLFGFENLYRRSFEGFKNLFKTVKSGSVRKLNFRMVTKASYFLVSNLMIVVYWLMISFLIFYPVWIELVSRII
ncbi:hypothetical protein FUAX_47360 (plasmid) [Fulvitalea axinellae]|uniref:Peptide zinc metalloprotease protein n=1 Tax=Fulvitalea axinellae TaxID=1182444 RepID=A0AAU9DCV6_9BACT|nr:hypothetical protein FUAX_47360 [Fulvitalea axinellae]